MEIQNVSVSVIPVKLPPGEEIVFLVCSGAPDCTAINREPCSMVANTCGPCFQRHLTTPGHEGFSNEPCFGESHIIRCPAIKNVLQPH